MTLAAETSTADVECRITIPPTGNSPSRTQSEGCGKSSPPYHLQERR